MGNPIDSPLADRVISRAIAAAAAMKANPRNGQMNFHIGDLIGADGREYEVWDNSFAEGLTVEMEAPNGSEDRCFADIAAMIREMSPEGFRYRYMPVTLLAADQVAPVSTSDRFARVVDQGDGKLVTLTPEQKKLFATVLVARYPQLATDDEEMNGGDTVDTLNELYADLCDADQSFVVDVTNG